MSTTNEENTNSFKICIVGDSYVGKTNTLLKYCLNQFNERQKETIGVDYFFKEMKYNKNKYKFHIWDSAGQEKFKGISKAYYKGTDGIILMYDITSKVSFNNLEK